MNYSRQRQLIKDTVIKNRIHPNADEVYSLVKQELPSISLATVYRNLNFLSDLKQLRRLTMPDGTYRFDGAIMPHQHAVCERCGKVLDFDYNITGFAQLAQYGFTVSNCELIVSGVCEKCKNNI